MILSLLNSEQNKKRMDPNKWTKQRKIVTDYECSLDSEVSIDKNGRKYIYYDSMIESCFVL